jgi:hypothetical protein
MDGLEARKSELKGRGASSRSIISAGNLPPFVDVSIYVFCTVQDPD